MLSTPSLDVPLQHVAVVADADLDTFELYKTLLLPHRYVVEQAITGPDALALAMNAKPAVVITEITLPLIDGAVLCKLLRDEPKTRATRLVVVTADRRPEQLERARLAGAHAILTKPCLPDLLLREIERVAAPVEQRLFESADAIASDRRRGQTKAPPLPPPLLRCPVCDQVLVYDESYVGGVSAKRPEQWDEFHCPSACGNFQFRHRTRTVRRSYMK
jgi:CheY-like chemotaxis protein